MFFFQENTRNVYPLRHQLNWLYRVITQNTIVIQYPDHVRTAASNVAKSLPPPKIV